jgi:cell division septum initiation protein DivIVA
MAFQLTGLRITGINKPTAEVVFTPGLNVISGPTDTGKSFIASCIDFMFGAKGPLKAIPELSGYSQVFLGVRSGNDHFTLERNHAGGEFNLYATEWNSLQGVEPKVLAAKHSPSDPNTVSAFFLGLSGLLGKQIRKNARNQIRSISFRDLARLLNVGEERIITSGSPVLSGEFVNKTEEIATLKLLLTGNDSTGLIAQKDSKIRKAELGSRLALLDQLITERERTLSSISNAPDEVEAQLQRLDASIGAFTESAALAETEMTVRESERKNAWTSIGTIDSRLITVKELLGRFSLLELHYRTDLSRLSATVETGETLTQVHVGECPLCGSPVGGHDHEEVPKDQDIQKLIAACVAEKTKISSLLGDLAQTVIGLRNEEAELIRERATQQDILNSAVRRLKEILEPTVRDSRSKLSALVEARGKLEKATSVLDELDEFRRMKEAVEKEIKTRPAKVKDSVVVEASEVDKFCQAIEELLKAWKYPDMSRVTFSEEQQDLVIEGKHRGNYGKGLRAISYAGFSIGLMKYCQNETLPYPGLVVLDSPLVTFRKPDVAEGEAISEDVKEAFYVSLAETPPSEQIIVLENEDPPAVVRGKINYIHFSKSSVGRYGFFPV